jgi:hypothetical protein
MTPKEKAFKLKYKYSKLLDLKSTDELVLKCALSAVDEILDELPFENKNREYWYRVQFEIEQI